MKNLHVLPTDKLSKLYKVKEKFYIEEYPVTTVNAGNQNIYITNSEVIKEGEISYIIDKQNNIRKVERVQTKNIGTPSYYCNSHSCDSSVSNVCYSIPIEDCKKIILTTDQDLIADGIQAIDDEFLEWFVKNPSCESVEIKDVYFNGSSYYDANQLSEQEKVIYSSMKEYKIIIPKEESKQILGMDYEFSIDDEGMSIQIPIIKQKTLEEAAENYSNKKGDIPTTKLENAIFKQGFIDDSKWQQERSYSEEDMREAFKEGFDSHYESADNLTIQDKEDVFIEQFKKK